MTNLLNKIPQLISSVDNSSLDEYNFSFSDPTKAVMQRNFSSLKKLASAYTYKETFNQLASTIESQITIADFIARILEKDLEVGGFLEKVAVALRLDINSTDIPSLVWASCIVADITGSVSEDVNSLFFSLQHSPAYKDVSPVDMRKGINDYFENLDESLGLKLDTVKNHLGVAFTSNSIAKDFSKWNNYKTFEQVKINENLQIGGLKAAINCLENGTIADFNAVYQFIKAEYLYGNKGTIGYCDNEFEREYKASIALACLAKAVGLAKEDEYDTLGFNLLARIKNIPQQLATIYPLAEITSILNKYDQEANVIVDQILKGTLIFSTQNKTIVSYISTAQTSAAISPAHEENYEDLNTYTKKQLSTFKKIADKKLDQLTKIMAYLTKNLSRKSNFAKLENQLDILSEEFDVELTSIDEQQNTLIRVHDNILLLLDAMNYRYDEINRCKDIFEKVRTKMGTNLDIEDIEFNNDFLGKLSLISSPYQERIIKDFYKLVKADPKLTLGRKFRSRSTTFIMAELKERTHLSKRLSNDIYSLFQAVQFTNSQQENYEKDKLLEQKYWEEQLQEDEFELEIK